MLAAGMALLGQQAELPGGGLGKHGIGPVGVVLAHAGNTSTSSETRRAGAGSLGGQDADLWAALLGRAGRDLQMVLVISAPPPPSSLVIVFLGLPPSALLRLARRGRQLERMRTFTPPR